jgi:hypothetical protein
VELRARQLVAGIEQGGGAAQYIDVGADVMLEYQLCVVDGVLKLCPVFVLDHLHYGKKQRARCRYAYPPYGGHEQCMDESFGNFHRAATTFLVLASAGLQAPWFPIPSCFIERQFSAKALICLARNLIYINYVTNLQ